jgi:transposase
VTADPAVRHGGVPAPHRDASCRPVETAREQLARDLVVEIRANVQRLTCTTAQIERTVAIERTFVATSSRLGEIDGIGPVVAGRLLGRTAKPRGFRPQQPLASYAGVAPLEVASVGEPDHCSRKPSVLRTPPVAASRPSCGARKPTVVRSR